MRIAFFVKTFPVVSETFILRQITGLLDLGHCVDIYAEWRGDSASTHPEIATYDLLRRTTYVDMPREAGFWEQPVLPITGSTWPPGSDKPIPNLMRIARALPVLARCLSTAPRLTFEALSPDH